MLTVGWASKCCGAMLMDVGKDDDGIAISMLMAGVSWMLRVGGCKAVAGGCIVIAGWVPIVATARLTAGWGTGAAGGPAEQVQQQ